MARDSRLDMSYTLKLHTKAHTFVRGRPTLKDVERFRTITKYVKAKCYK